MKYPMTSCYICGAPDSVIDYNKTLVSQPHDPWLCVCERCNNGQANGYRSSMPEGMAIKAKRMHESLHAAFVDTQKKPQGEKPCHQCGRNNDYDVSKCWHCEIPNPSPSMLNVPKTY